MSATIPAPLAAPVAFSPGADHVVQLLDGGRHETVYSGSGRNARHWVRLWLKEPLGITVAIVPPLSAKAEGGAE